MFRIAAATLVLWSAIAFTQGQPQIRISDLEQQINTLVNSQRQANNLKPLILDDKLSKIAREHSVITHGNQKSYDWKSLNEIADSTVKGWMASSGHRQNTLEKNYSRAGIGAAIAADGQVYITQVFCG